MPTLISLKPVLPIGISLFLPLVLLWVHKRPNLRDSAVFIAAVLKFMVIVSFLPHILSGGRYEITLVHFLPGVSIALRVDGMGLLFALVSSSLWILAHLYCIGYLRGLDEHSQTRFYSFFSLSLSAAVGVAFSANLFTMYLFYEMLSFATYPLVAHHQDGEAKSSGRKYLFYIVGTSIGIVLPCMIVIYQITGTLEFTDTGILSLSRSGAGILMLFFLFGFAKAAVMPLHSWLPAAMVAPTPVSALLHAVAVVKVGVFSIFRVMTGIFGVGMLSLGEITTIISCIASFTIIAASLIALSQDGLKRLLAFSTIGQLSYIVLGASLGTEAGMTGGMLHIAMHGFGKITLFFCAGAIFVATGEKYISKMDGIGKRMPFTMGAFFIAALSVIGLPPLGGFISKWYLCLGALDAGKPFFLIVILVSSFLNAVYFLPVVYRAFFKTPAEGLYQGKIQEAPLFCLIPLMVTAFISIIFFFYPKPFLSLATMASQAFLGM